MSKTLSAYNNGQPPTCSSIDWRNRLFTEDYQLLVDTFNILDENATGFIDPSEVADCVKKLGADQTNPFILSLMNGLTEMNGPITLDIFIEYVVSNVGDFKTKDGIQKIFNLYDVNANQLVSTFEFQAVARSIHECITADEIDEMIHDIYVKWGLSSPDGLVFDEFYQVVSNYVT